MVGSYTANDKTGSPGRLASWFSTTGTCAPDGGAPGSAYGRHGRGPVRTGGDLIESPAARRRKSVNQLTKLVRRKLLSEQHFYRCSTVDGLSSECSIARSATSALRFSRCSRDGRMRRVAARRPSAPRPSHAYLRFVGVIPGCERSLVLQATSK